MIQHELTQLGFTEEESKVYLAALELGGSYASGIAKKAGVPRVNCYHTLDKLVRKGVMSTFIKNPVLRGAGGHQEHL